MSSVLKSEILKNASGKSTMTPSPASPSLSVFRIDRISKEGKYCNRILPRAEMSCIALEINLGPRGSKSRKNEYFPDIDEKKILVGIM